MAIIMPLPRLLLGVSMPPSIGLSWSTTAFTSLGVFSLVRGLKPDSELASLHSESVHSEPPIKPLVSLVAVHPLLNSMIQGHESSCCLRLAKEQWLLMYVFLIALSIT